MNRTDVNPEFSQLRTLKTYAQGLRVKISVSVQACFCAFIPILFLLFGLCVDVSVCVSVHRVDLFSK